PLWRETAGGDTGSYNAHWFLFAESLPDCLRRQFGRGEHAFDWAKDRQFGAIQLFLCRERRGRADVTEQHVRFFDLVEWNFERVRDCFFHQSFAQTDPKIAG